jgi:hypothetical protein
MAGGNRLATSEQPIRDMALLNLQLQLAAPPWRPRLQSTPQMRGCEQQADTARRKRSALARPPGSGQRAGAAQGLWGPVTSGRGQDHLDRSLGVGLPGGMDHHRPGARPGPNPAADHLATQQQPSRGSALIGRPGALGEQRPGGHPDRGQPKHGAKVEGKAGAARMVAAGGVDQQDLGGERQGTHGLLEQRPFAEGEQGRQIRPTGGPTDGHPGQQAAAVGDRCPGEPSVTGGTGPLDAFEADEAGADPQHGRRRLPVFGGQLPQGLLQLGELVSGGRPGRHTR